MEEALTRWLLDNRPYTGINRRLKHFIVYCRQQVPGLSWTKLKREVYGAADKLMLGEVGRLWLRDRAYERVLRLYGMNDQRSAQWHAKRGEMITASEVYKVFGAPGGRMEVMMRKLEPPAPSDGKAPAAPLLWGTRFEAVAKKIYEDDTNCKITDVSCVQHPKYSFLGASPDGLIVPNDDDPKRYGRLVEFKCPMSRVLKDEIPIAYVHQMQMQMECTGIDECEYVEFRFKQMSYNEWCRAEGTKGSFVVHVDGKVDYDVADTANEESQVVYWALTSIKKDFVAKDPNWLPEHLAALESFWSEVVRHREAGTLPDPPKTERPTLDV